MNILKKFFIVTGIILLINFGLTGINILQKGIGGYKGKKPSEILGVPAENATLNDMKKLSKSDLMQLFYSTKPPKFSDFKGEYQAETLPVGILSPAADFYTHNFFGPGRWIGKAFLPHEKNSGKGYNLFKDKNSKIHRTREMDTFIEKSEIDDNNSFHIVYKAYNSGMIHSMHDELRKVNDNLIIGMGYMLAGGGSINPAPFVLSGTPKEWVGPDN